MVRAHTILLTTDEGSKYDGERFKPYFELLSFASDMCC